MVCYIDGRLLGCCRDKPDLMGGCCLGTHRVYLLWLGHWDQCETMCWRTSYVAGPKIESETSERYVATKWNNRGPSCALCRDACRRRVPCLGAHPWRERYSLFLHETGYWIGCGLALASLSCLLYMDAQRFIVNVVYSMINI